MTASPTIGIALGSGGARGLAHIPYIEALDALGIRPDLICGTSIGALIGAGWASGMTGAALREHALASLGSVQEMAGRLWMTSRPTLQGVIKSGISLQVDARNIVEAFLPEHFPTDFSALDTPLEIIATDYYGWRQVVFDSGDLREAIAASLAIPSLFSPVMFEGRLYIDGGAVNPLPVGRARHRCDIVIAIDVNGTPAEPDSRLPSPFDVGLVATQIMTEAMVQAALALDPPDIYVHPVLEGIRTLEFWRVRDIMELADQEMDAFKVAVEMAMTAYRERAAAGG